MKFSQIEQQLCVIPELIRLRGGEGCDFEDS